MNQPVVASITFHSLPGIARRPGLPALRKQNPHAGAEAAPRQEPAIRGPLGKQEEQALATRALQLQALSNKLHQADGLAGVQDAVEIAREAVDTFLHLARHDPTAYVRELASSLDELVNLLSLVGRGAEALARGALSASQSGRIGGMGALLRGRAGQRGRGGPLPERARACAAPVQGAVLWAWGTLLPWPPCLEERGRA